MTVTSPTLKYYVTLRYLRTGRVRRLPAQYPTYLRAVIKAREWERMYTNQGRRVLAEIVTVEATPIPAAQEAGR